MSFMQAAIIQETIEYLVLDPYCDEIPEADRETGLMVLTKLVGVNSLRALY